MKYFNTNANTIQLIYSALLKSGNTGTFDYERFVLFYRSWQAATVEQPIAMNTERSQVMQAHKKREQ